MEKKKFKATFEFVLTDKGIELSTEFNFKILPTNAEKAGKILAIDLINFLTGDKMPEDILHTENITVTELYDKDTKHKFDANTSKCQKCEYLPTCLQKYKKIN